MLPSNGIPSTRSSPTRSEAIFVKSADHVPDVTCHKFSLIGTEKCCQLVVTIGVGLEKRFFRDWRGIFHGARLRPPQWNQMAVLNRSRFRYP
jgi:hypothetical protein